MKPKPQGASRLRFAVRTGALVVAATVFWVAGRADLLATAIAVAIGVGTLFAVRHRRRGAIRTLVLMSGVFGGLAALVAALALPVLRYRQAPLVVQNFDVGTAAANSVAPVSTPATNGRIVLGFAASDYDDTGAGVDRDASALSIVAATTMSLGTDPGTLSVAQATDSLIRAHMAGAHGFAVLTNNDGNDFNSDRATAVLSDGAARSRLVSAVTAQVSHDGWDGLVIDIELVPPQFRNDFTQLVMDLRTALTGRTVYVAVPAFADASKPDAAAYDLRALADGTDGVVWMAYDQHDPQGDPGPIAGLPWVRATLRTAVGLAPPSKLLLGLGGYAYVWPGHDPAIENLPCDNSASVATAANNSDAPRPADECTSSDLAILQGTEGATSHWDSTQQELTGTTADGRRWWFDDAQATGVRARLVDEFGLAGVALWRIGSESPGALATLPFPAEKFAPILPDRPLELQNGSGVVALTFDDGPDPTWTPQILDVLRREHVPATFFVIGDQVEKYPSIARNELADGNVIGNHTYSHQDTNSIPDWRTTIEILAGEMSIEGTVGRKPLLFRTPYGGGDSLGQHKGADQIATELGLHPIGWNDDPNDWARPGADTIVTRVETNATKRTIVLLHDGGGDRAQTLAALPRIIDDLRARGYMFTTVDGLDAGLPSAYATRSGFWANARGVAIVAGFRLYLSLSSLLLWVVLLTAAVSIGRVLFAGPLAMRHWWRHRGPPPPVRPVSLRHPISVVVPAYNEAKVIAKTIAALLQCDPAPLEIVVVDDGSTDDTAAMVASVPAPPGMVRLIPQPNSGKATALNRGIAAASAELVMVIDADTIVDRSIIGRFEPYFDRDDVGAVAGNVKVGNRRSLLSVMQALEYVVALNLDRRAQDVARVMAVVPGAAGVFRRAALREVGGYPSDTLVEDADLTAMLLRAGWRIPYEPSAIAWTEAPQTVRDVVRQRRRWSFGTIQVVAKHAHAIFEPTAGPLGIVGLPWMMVTQVVLPVLGPFADIWLLLQILSGNWNVAVSVVVLAVVADVVISVVALAADRERPALLLATPLLRVLWRPLQLLIAVRSAVRWTVGGDETWNKVSRYDSVDLEQRQPKTEQLTA